MSSIILMSKSSSSITLSEILVSTFVGFDNSFRNSIFTVAFSDSFSKQFLDSFSELVLVGSNLGSFGSWLY